MVIDDLAVVGWSPDHPTPVVGSGDPPTTAALEPKVNLSLRVVNDSY